jgi:hypothetical protein
LTRVGRVKRERELIDLRLKQEMNHQDDTGVRKGFVAKTIAIVVLYSRSRYSCYSYLSDSLIVFVYTTFKTDELFFVPINT